MEIRMIVCDLDQTLLRSDKEVSAHTLEVLERCRAAGIVIAVATARSESSAERIIRAVRPDVAITSGGAMVRCGDEIVAENLLGAEAANAMVARFLATEGIGYITYRTYLGYFVNREFDRTDVSWQDYENAQLVDLNQKIEHGLQKFVLEIPLNEARAIAADFPDAALIQYSGGDWVQFACKTATKWNGVLAAAKHFGIETGNIAAFGDDFNDVEMLEKCGIGVAMANAIPEAKAVANFVAASNDEDGVARWLEENIL